MKHHWNGNGNKFYRMVSAIILIAIFTVIILVITGLPGCKNYVAECMEENRRYCELHSKNSVEECLQDICKETDRFIPWQDGRDKRL